MTWASLWAVAQQGLTQPTGCRTPPSWAAKRPLRCTVGVRSRDVAILTVRYDDILGFASWMPGKKKATGLPKWWFHHGGKIKNHLKQMKVFRSKWWLYTGTKASMKITSLKNLHSLKRTARTWKLMVGSDEIRANMCQSWSGRGQNPKNM